MTGFPDDPLDGPDGDRTDPLGPLLRPPAGYLSAPPGAFERIRHRAARRRRLRAAAGSTAAAAVVAGALYLTGVVTPGDGGDEVVGPPASQSGISTGPATPAPSTRPSAPPPMNSGGAGAAAGGQGTAPTTAPSTGDPGAPTSTPSGATPMCTASQLTGSLGGSDAAAGSLYRYLVLTNHSDTACHVTGYPGLSMLDAHGGQIGQPATRRALAYSPVVLAPGGAASATIHTVNQQGTCLATSVRLRMYPPGSKASLTFPGQVTNCDDQFEITPFTGGRTGNPPA